MNVSTEISLSKAALKNNLQFLKSEFGDNPILSGVVKGNAYGHGIIPFSSMLKEEGINHMSVFSVDEAEIIRKNCGEDVQILIMGDVENEGLEWAIHAGIDFYVFDFQRLEQAVFISKKLGKKARIHIELETGMNRTGFEEDNWDDLISFFNKNQTQIEFSGLCTHFAGAESMVNFNRIEHQRVIYNRGIQYFKNHGWVAENRHSCCSAAAMRFPNIMDSLYRIGILQYGYWPSREILIEYQYRNNTRSNPLLPVLTWKSRIMAVKKVPEGDYIGYGTSYMAHDKMRIGIVPVGYAHGFSRSLSNQGRVLVRGERISVVGIVNMNCIAVNISNLPEAEKGDEVVIIGKQGDLELTVSSFSESSSQVNYEMLTRLPAIIPRTIIN